MCSSFVRTPPLISQTECGLDKLTGYVGGGGLHSASANSANSSALPLAAD